MTKDVLENHVNLVTSDITRIPQVKQHARSVHLDLQQE